MIPPDRVYLDPGDRWCGRYDPPRRCAVVTQWGRGSGPRNVAVRYLDDGSVAVIPFSRRLRRLPGAQTTTGKDIPVTDITSTTARPIRHVILDQPLSCWAQMETARRLADELGAVLHGTARVLGEPARKRPGMGSGCMPRTSRGYDRCRHDLAALRREGAVDITDSAECWTPGGSPCTTCHGARGATKTAVPDEYPDAPAALFTRREAAGR